MTPKQAADAKHRIAMEKSWANLYKHIKQLKGSIKRVDDDLAAIHQQQKQLRADTQAR